MKDTKGFIEEIIPQMDSPEKVHKLFHGLGYKTLGPSFRGKEAWELREKDKESVREIYTIANYQKRFQIFCGRTEIFLGTHYPKPSTLL